MKPVIALFSGLLLGVLLHGLLLSPAIPQETKEPPLAKGPFRPRPRPTPPAPEVESGDRILFGKVRQWIDQRIDERQDQLAERFAERAAEEMENYDPSGPNLHAGFFAAALSGFVVKVMKAALAALIGAAVAAAIFALVYAYWHYAAAAGAALLALFVGYVEWRVKRTKT